MPSVIMGGKRLGLGVVGVSNSSGRSFGGRVSVKTRLDMAAMAVEARAALM